MIHKFRLFDTNIVLDVNSGAVHVFDDISYDVLEHFKTSSKEEITMLLKDKYSEGQINDVFAEIESLKSQNTLFSEDHYEKHIDTSNKESVVKALCLHVSHDCNLRCEYCFAGTGDFGGERLQMSEEVGKAAIDLLIKSSGKRKNLEVDFFGGEPLMNFDVVKKVVSYAREKEKDHNKNFRFTITTNGLGLNEDNKKYINENMSNVVLSIDGRKSVNDKMRYTVNQKGSYDTIMPKFKDLVEERGGKNYYVRGTFTSQNLDFAEDVLHLADEGFKEISIEPVVALEGSGLDIKSSDIDAISREYEKLAKELIERKEKGDEFNFFHFMIDLDQGPCVIKRIRGCGAGHEYIAVTPEGDIYPCHQFVGNDDFKMGNVKNMQIDNKELSNTFQKSNIYTKEACKTCWARFYCSGGCAANAYQFKGTINSVHELGCALEKKRLECAIWIKTQEV